MNMEQALNNNSDLETAVRELLNTGSPAARKQVGRIGQILIDYYASIYSPGKKNPYMKEAATRGFMKAIKKYDPSRGVPFATYATHCIINEIRQVLRERMLFKTPEWLIKLQENVIKATEELTVEKTPLPTLEDIASRLNIAEKGIVEAMQAGNVSVDEIDLSALKSIRHETFKLPIEDVIVIRKSMDRLADIQRKVLTLISQNLSELNLAMEEEERALTETQKRYLRMVDTYSITTELDSIDDDIECLINFPEQLDEALADEVRRYFEVLSDEFGLRLTELQIGGSPNKVDGSYLSVPLDLKLEGRYRGLLQMLDYLRNREKSIQLVRVRTARSKKIPARIIINIKANTYYKRNT